MDNMPAFLDADIWLRHLFSSKAAQQGGVVRRKVRDVERIVGRVRFERELIRRGYHAVENSGHFVIFCNNAPIKPVC